LDRSQPSSRIRCTEEAKIPTATPWSALRGMMTNHTARICTSGVFCSPKMCPTAFKPSFGTSILGRNGGQTYKGSAGKATWLSAASGWSANITLDVPKTRHSTLRYYRNGHNPSGVIVPVYRQQRTRRGSEGSSRRRMKRRRENVSQVVRFFAFLKDKKRVIRQKLRADQLCFCNIVNGR